MSRRSAPPTDIPPDALTWDYWVQPMQTQQDGLSATTRAGALAAVQVFRQAFGEDWIASAVTDYHPFLSLMIDHTSFNWTFLAEVAHGITALHTVSGVERLVARLRRAADCIGALPELDIASRLVEARYHLTLYPRVGNLRPDIRVDAANPLYIEITTVHVGPDPAIQTFHQLLPAVMAVGGLVHTSGEIRRPIGAAHLAYVREEIQQTAHEAARVGEVRCLRDGEFELTFFPNRILDQLDEPLRKAAHEGIGARGSRSSPSDRTARRLFEKLRQIPAGAQGIVVLHDRMNVDEQWLPWIAEQLARTLDASPRTGAAVFITRHAFHGVPDLGVEAAPFGWVVRRPVILPVLALNADPVRSRIGRETALVVRNERAGLSFDEGLLLQALRTSRLAF